MPMKRLLVTTILSFILLAADLPAAHAIDQDSTHADSTHKKRSAFNLKDGPPEQSRLDKALPGLLYGITFARLDVGLSTMLDNGSFKLSDDNKFLRYRPVKSGNIGFDLAQAGYRFTDKFKIYLSAGFDWNHIRLREDITILKDSPELAYQASESPLKKNRLSSTYLRLPLVFELRGKENYNGSRLRFVAGPELGLLLKGKTKQKSEAFGKVKETDDYHFTKVRYGLVARLGHGALGLYGKYYFNNLFENSPRQEGLHTLALGLMFSFW